MTGPILSRRRLLASAGAGFLTAPLLGSAALSADQSGYKALVCLFFLGGMDTHDTIIGHDVPSYNDWLARRQTLVDQFASAGSPGARDRTNLLALNPVNAADFGSREFGMPQELAPLHALFQSGEMAIVPNVGPLIVPTTRQEFKDKSVPRPARLRSHNDQQYTWQSLNVEGSVLGWGGRLADIGGAGQDYSAMSVSSRTVFLSGQSTQPVQLGSGGVQKFFGSGNSVYGSTELASLLKEHYREAGAEASNYFMRDLGRAQAEAIDRNAFLADIINGQTLGNAVEVEGNGFSRRLATVADVIGARDQLGATRQVFYATMGGFDTHDGHVRRMPQLHDELAVAISSFYAALKSAGLQDQVTIFTASDFGRTLKVNSTGTDHGWGAHQFVLGGAVQGGRIYGTVPPFAENHDQDADRGVLIPTTSVEQYGAALARWFGLSEGEIDSVFPTLSNFDRNALIF